MIEKINPELLAASQDIPWMELALQQARLAEDSGEVPVGALVVKEGTVLGVGHNRTLLDNDPTAHAEIVAMRRAAAATGNYRLLGCALFSTIEPCAMCAGAMVQARLARLVYGAADPKAGAAGSVLQVLNHPGLNHKMDVQAGILAGRCAELLRAFFRKRRK